MVKPTTEKYAEYPTPRFPDQLRGNQQSSQQEIKQLPLAPDSGQRIRLRGGAGRIYQKQIPIKYKCKV